jgi:hypothetical protein
MQRDQELLFDVHQMGRWQSVTHPQKEPSRGSKERRHKIMIPRTDDRPTIQLPPPVADIYRAVATMERQYPGPKFTPDGHLVGAIGEVIAAEHFGLKLLPLWHPSHDAADADGRLVQIKLTAGNSVSMYADCDRLIVLRVVSPEQAEIVYDGPGAPVWAAAGKMQKNGQRKIALSKLFPAGYIDKTSAAQSRITRSRRVNTTNIAATMAKAARKAHS